MDSSSIVGIVVAEFFLFFLASIIGMIASGQGGGKTTVGSSIFKTRMLFSLVAWLGGLVVSLFGYVIGGFTGLFLGFLIGAIVAVVMLRGKDG